MCKSVFTSFCMQSFDKAMACVSHDDNNEYSCRRLTTDLLPVPKPGFIPLLVEVPWVCFTLS